MAVYRVVFYKSLIFKTSKNNFYPTFQFAIFMNTIIKARLQNSRFFSLNRDCSLIVFVASGLINSDAFRRRVMLFNTSSQDYMVLLHLATVPSGPFVTF